MTEKISIISSFYNIESVIVPIHRLSPGKLILFIHDSEEKGIQDNVQKLKGIYGTIMEIDVTKANMYDTLTVAEKVVNCIETEHKQGNKIIVNLTGGTKILALGVLFGAFARAEYIERIVYGAEKDPQLYDLPKIGYNLGETKLKVLKELQKDNAIVSELAKKVDITPAMAYVHLKELKSQGYINDADQITLAGKLALL